MIEKMSADVATNLQAICNVVELKRMLSEKASGLFAICDQEDKGFVTKRDMQRMRNELPLDPDQLESVFDRLDADQNGYLTLEEFTEGLGDFLGLDTASIPAGGTMDEAESEEQVNGADVQEDIDEEEEFNEFLIELGIMGLVEDDEALRAMWVDLKRRGNDPVLMANFESFLTKLSKDIHQKTSEQDKLESSVKSRNREQDLNLKKLYEEMEQQLTSERARLRTEEVRKESKLREEMVGTLEMKDRQLQEVMENMRVLHSSLDEAKKAVPDIRDENAHLSKDRDRLQSEVNRQRILMKELSDQMDELRSVILCMI
jgi:Ras and EF-hand domain-containing protein